MDTSRGPALTSHTHNPGAQESIIQRAASFVRRKLDGEGTGHDWWHVCRVWRTAIQIAEKEHADLFTVQLAALLHDIADWKFHGGDDSMGPRIAEQFLSELQVRSEIVSNVCRIIKKVSFKGSGVCTVMDTPEGKTVQDADRLDALGAIGIARAFAYGGSMGRELYSPHSKPQQFQTFEHYKSGKGPTINHFYEKLLLLKDRMQTETGRAMAEDRHRYMEEYLRQFYKEWNGE